MNVQTRASTRSRNGKNKSKLSIKRARKSRDLHHLLGKEYSQLLRADAPEDIGSHIIEYVRQLFEMNGKVPSTFLKALLNKAINHFKKQPNVVSISRPEENGRFTVVGDLHGQYRDFAHLIKEGSIVGIPSIANKVLFNGDIVDRGDMAVEILVMVLLYKVYHSEAVYITRGNHESDYCSNMFGFMDEVDKKYLCDDSAKLRTLFLSLFMELPIAAVYDDAVFVTHGGLGAKSSKASIAEINSVNRRQEPEEDAIMHELLWNGTVIHFQTTCFIVIVLLLT